MGFLTNTFIRYFDRTYQQIKQQVLTDLAFFTPEITDNSESNPLVKALGIWAAIVEMLGYYIDNAAREAFLDSCRRYLSAVKIAKLMDYRIMSSIPATVDLTFTISAIHGSDITIPSGTICQTDDAIIFVTNADIIIQAGQTVGVGAATQVEFVTGASVGTSNGQANQTFLLAENLADNRLQLIVNAITWNPQDTFAYSIATDEDFVCTVNEKGIPIVKLGDGESGAIPSNGAVITANYQTTQGALGNVAANMITTINSTLTLPVGITCTVNNLYSASNGTGVETLTDLKNHIPKWLRTLRRAVTGDDIIDVAEQCEGVSRAGFIFNCGKTVDVYCLPVGGGIASSGLLTTLFNWFDDKRMITSKINTYASGLVETILAYSLIVKPNYANATVSAAVKTNLLNFFAQGNQEINGQVRLSDLYEIIEDTEGVNYSEITLLTCRPYARPLNITSPQLNWTRVINPASTGTHKYTVTFINPTTFQLSMDNTFLGNFTVATPVITTNVNFTINAGAYATGNSYQFVSYEYNIKSIVLDEPSILTLDNADITATVSGGI